MNKRAQELIRYNVRVRIASFILFWVGVELAVQGIKLNIDTLLASGELILVLSFYFFERANYHSAVLKGYHMGFYDAVKGNNYQVIFSPDDALIDRKDMGK